MRQPSIRDTGELERAVIGACMLDREALDEALSRLDDDDFSLSSHKLLARRMRELDQAGKPADLLTVMESLRDHGELESIGGAAYLASMTDGLPYRCSVSAYVDILLERSRLRRLGAIGNSLAAGAEDPAADAEQLSADIESRLLELRAGAAAAAQTHIGSSIVPLLDRIRREHSRTGELLGLPTGIDPYDATTRGLHPGEVATFGAASGTGKSVCVTQVAGVNCQNGTPVLIISPEMSRDQILRRLLSAASGVSYPRIRDPKWAQASDLAAIDRAAEEIAEWPLHIVDDSGITIEKLTAHARLAIRRHGVRLICVDYVQIVNAPGRDERLRISAVSRGLTRLAKDEGVAVLALSQLARPDRSSVNRRPVMSDLRESSQLENDAHVVALLHRERDENGRLSSDAELIIAKHRNGETGIFPLTFDRRTLTFQSRAAAAVRERATA